MHLLFINTHMIDYIKFGGIFREPDTIIFSKYNTYSGIACNLFYCFVTRLLTLNIRLVPIMLT